jgi:hypothetical protein
MVEQPRSNWALGDQNFAIIWTARERQRTDMRVEDNVIFGTSWGAVMGTWGVGSFENDNAVDWTYGLASKSDLSYVESTLDKVLNFGPSFLEAPDAEEAIAAAETVARLLGRFAACDAYTKPIDDWVSQVSVRPSSQLIEKARRALERIQQEPSELLELWNENTDAKAWKDSVTALAMRISS